MPGLRSTPKRVWTIGRRKSKSASSVVLPARWASRQRQIGGGKRFAFSRRCAGDHDRVNRLQRLQVIETRTQSAELFHGRLVGARYVDQQGIGGRAERYFLHQFEEAFEITYSRIEHRRTHCGLSHSRSAAA